eukprot:7941070-Lingulodinium_polyedra.AAC.1
MYALLSSRLISSRLVLYCSITPCLASPRLVSSCLVLSRPVLSCLASPRLALSCPVYSTLLRPNLFWSSLVFSTLV